MISDTDLPSTKERSSILLRTTDYFAQSILLSNVLAAGICVAIMLCTVWICQHGAWFARDTEHSQTEIQEAVRLISDAQQIREQNATTGEAKQLQSIRLQGVCDWLPEEIDWTILSNTILQQANVTGLEVIDLSQTDKHDGSRVSVQGSQCVVTGTFAQVCQFLSELANGPRPTWCNAIRLDRIESDERESNLCQATISLRSPLRGSNTIADKIMQENALNLTAQHVTGTKKLSDSQNPEPVLPQTKMNRQDHHAN